MSDRILETSTPKLLQLAPAAIYQTTSIISMDWFKGKF